MKYLEGYMERHTEGEETDLHFLMIDLDDFKQINDTYGHVEGDRALIRIAGVLKKTLAGHAGILARYGGDEFCIAGEMLREETEQLIKNLYENLEKANKQADCPYDIGMSVGCAQFTRKIIPAICTSQFAVYFYRIFGGIKVILQNTLVKKGVSSWQIIKGYFLICIVMKRQRKRNASGLLRQNKSQAALN